jgi:hypothetical protein
MTIDMTVWLTKVWGFGVPCGPLQFGMAGRRDRARHQLSNGDLVVLVGTKDKPTPESERGYLLGIMEPAKEPALSLDFDLPIIPEDYTETGDYRWPYALLNRRAWLILDRPKLEQVSSRNFSMDAVSGIVRLTDQEAERVLSLQREEVPLLTSIRIDKRLYGAEVARRRGAPPPTTTRIGVMHLRRAPAYTYAMKIHGAEKPAFKIGWAFDYTNRVRQFNPYSLPKLGGVNYEVVFAELWSTARKAFDMEQDVLNSFDGKRHPSNREVLYDISLGQLQSAWGQSLLTIRHPTRKKT